VVVFFLVVGGFCLFCFWGGGWLVVFVVFCYVGGILWGGCFVRWGVCQQPAGFGVGSNLRVFQRERCVRKKEGVVWAPQSTEKGQKKKPAIGQARCGCGDSRPQKLPRKRGWKIWGNRR